MRSALSSHPTWLFLVIVVKQFKALFSVCLDCGYEVQFFVTLPDLPAVVGWGFFKSEANYLLHQTSTVLDPICTTGHTLVLNSPFS